MQFYFPVSYFIFPHWSQMIRMIRRRVQRCPTLPVALVSGSRDAPPPEPWCLFAGWTLSERCRRSACWTRAQVTRRTGRYGGRPEQNPPPVTPTFPPPVAAPPATAGRLITWKTATKKRRPTGRKKNRRRRSLRLRLQPGLLNLGTAPPHKTHCSDDLSGSRARGKDAAVFGWSSLRTSLASVVSP